MNRTACPRVPGMDAEPGQLVRGIIVAREISEDLILACFGVPGVELFEYEMSVAVKKVAV